MSFGLEYGKKRKDENGKVHSVNTMNGERFVYYNRLKTDAYHHGKDDWRRKLYDKASSVLNWRITYGGDPTDISIYFAHLSEYEFDKEKALLETHFKGKTNYDPKSAQCGKDLIDAYNEIINIKEIFDRNRILLTNTSQKNLIAFFPTYLDKALEEFMDDKNFEEKIEKIMEENTKQLEKSGFDIKLTKSEKIKEAIEKYVNDNTYKIVERALDLMFSSETKAENGLKKRDDYDKLGKAYKEIFDALQKFKEKGRSNQFINGAIEVYGLNKLGQAITESFGDKKVNMKNAKGLVSNFKFKTHLKTKGNTYEASLGGIFTEIFGQFAAEVNLSNKGVDVKGFHTGQNHKPVEQKVDMMLTIGFNDGAAEAMEEKLRKFEGSGRGTNVRDINKLTEEMFRDFGNDNSFMIFINSKNYTTNWKFRNGYISKNGGKFGGYSAGSPIDLNTWDDMMHQMNVKGRDFIFTIMQLIPHAIGNPNGDDRNKEAVSMMFARAIGSALLDDFEPDDPVDKKEHGPKIIHLLYLNGVYIPLSVFYTLLSKAFSDLENSLEMDNLVQVEFDLPDDILYPTQRDQRNAIRSGVEHPWTEQSNVALNSIKVSYHFLKGFQDFLREFYGLN